MQERNLRRQLRIDVDGRLFTPQRTPTRISEVPWNSIVVTRVDTTPASLTTPVDYTAHDLYLFLSQQLSIVGLGPPPLEFRISMVEAWNFGENAAIIMDVSPLQTYSAIPAKIARLEDQPGKNQWAAVGYEWPRSHRNYVFQDSGPAVPATNPNICRVYSDIVGSRFWVRWHMLWRHSVSIPPQLTRLQNLADDFERLSCSSEACV